MMGDSGASCTPERGCASSEVCLAARCYPRCSEARPCGLREFCSSDGVCVAAADFDAGVEDAGVLDSGVSDSGTGTDAGPVDPCDHMTCGAPTPYCRAGICLECESGADCQLREPNTTCDHARGICVPPQSGICAPCNVDSDCTVADARLRCLTRDAPAPIERVCLYPCSSEPCVVGGECDPLSSFCVPKYNGSCTNVWAVLQSRSCRTAEGMPNDAACAPVGATAGMGLFEGACFDSSGGSNYQCHVPCRATEDCFAGVCTASMFCDGE